MGISLVFDPTTLAVVASFELTILAFVWAIRKTTVPLYPIMSVMGRLSPRQIKLLARFAERQLVGDPLRPGSGIIGGEERRIEKGLEEDVD